MAKMKFNLADASFLPALLDALKGLNPQTNVSETQFELRVKNIIRYTEGRESNHIQIYFNDVAAYEYTMLEYSFDEHFFQHGESTQDYQHIDDIPAFIAQHSVPDEDYSNVVLHVNSPGEMRAALKRLLSMGKISQTEYNACFPTHAPEQYARHQTIFLTDGVVTFSLEVRNTRYHDNGYGKPRVVDMSVFLANGELRPHYHLHLEWLQDTSVQIEMKMSSGNWEILPNPGFSPNCEYRRYVAPPAKSADELAAEKILAGLEAGVLKEIKRQLEEQNDQI